MIFSLKKNFKSYTFILGSVPVLVLKKGQTNKFLPTFLICITNKTFSSDSGGLVSPVARPISASFEIQTVEGTEFPKDLMFWGLGRRFGRRHSFGNRAGLIKNLWCALSWCGVTCRKPFYLFLHLYFCFTCTDKHKNQNYEIGQE